MNSDEMAADASTASGMQENMLCDVTGFGRMHKSLCKDATIQHTTVQHFTVSYTKTAVCCCLSVNNTRQ